MNLKSLLSFVAGTFLVTASTGLYAHNHEHSVPGNSGVKFVENKGQWNAEAKYKAIVPGGEMYITKDGFMYNFYNEQDLSRIHKLRCVDATNDNGVNVDNEVVNMHAYRVRFEGAQVNANTTFTGSESIAGKDNFFIGNDPSKWATNVSSYGEVNISNLYPNVDMVVYTSDQSVKYDLVVKANTNPNVIQLGFDGVTPVLKANGDLYLKTSVNEVVEAAPITYQMINNQKVAVASKYKLVDGKLTFDFPNGYNSNYDLVIDPDLVFYTYSGGTGFSYYSYTSGYDTDGNMVTAGDAWGAGWPTSTGAYQTVYGGGGHEVCIIKFSADGSTKMWATYYGGNNWDLPHSVWLDESFNVFVGGSTQSSNLPMAANAFDNTLGGSGDWFICKLNPDGTQLLGSTYVGGSGTDINQFTLTTTGSTITNYSSVNTPLELFEDNAGNIWLVGNTNSTDFPTVTPQYGTLAGQIDGFIAKFNSGLSSLLYGTYFGGSGNDVINSIAQKSNGDIVFAGITYSTNLPVANGLQPTSGGGTDGFVGILNYNTNAVTNLSYLGTTATDHAVGLQVDCNDNIYVLGRTGGNYPVSPNVWNVANGGAFIDKLDATVSSRLLSTRLANSNTSFMPSSFLVDLCGRVYVGGFGASSGLFTTPDAYDPVNRSFYFITFEQNFSDVVYASYFGQSGDHNHIGSHRLDPKGHFYHTICNITQFQPINPNVFQPTRISGGQDVLSFKFNFEANAMNVKPESPEGGNNGRPHAIRGCKSAFLHYYRAEADTADMSIKIRISGDAINGVDYQYIDSFVVIPAGDTTAKIEIKALPRPFTGNRMVIIETFSNCSCGTNSIEESIASVDTVLIIDSIYVAMITPNDTTCPGDQFDITGVHDHTLKYEWNPANLITAQNGLTITVNPSVTTQFHLRVWQEGAPATCPDRYATYTAMVEPYPVIDIPNDHLIICYKDSISMTMQVTPENLRYKYQWGPVQYFSDASAMTTKFLAPIGSYTIFQTASTPGANCTSTDSMIIEVVPPLTINGISPADTLISLGDQIRLTALDSNKGVMYSWTPTSTIEDPLTRTVKVQPDVTTVYHVTVWDQYGCYDTASAIVRVGFIPRFFLPNAFSPNGDGLNDEFKMGNLTYEKLVSFRIFNRLGEMVFETTDPNKGWNGTNGNAKELPNDVYFYHIIISGPTKDTEWLEFKGDVTLVR